MQLTVITAATHKENSFDDAFAPCPDCDDDTPIYKVTCSHADTTIASVFVPQPALVDAIITIILTTERLAPRIDAANLAFAEAE